MRVLVTGSREWADREKIVTDITDLYRSCWLRGEKLTIIHGDARGADRIAGEVAESLGANVYRFPAEWQRLGPGAGPIRNIEMLDTCQPDLVLAYPLPLSVGTLHCIDQARERGIPVRLS